MVAELDRRLHTNGHIQVLKEGPLIDHLSEIQILPDLEQEISPELDNGDHEQNPVYNLNHRLLQRDEERRLITDAQSWLKYKNKVRADLETSLKRQLSVEEFTALLQSQIEEANYSLIKKQQDELGRYPTLEEISARLKTDSELAGQHHRGEAALSTLVGCSMRLVAKFVFEFKKSHLEKEERFQEGIKGLITAIVNFDLNRGTRLSTYATPWIRQTIRRAIARQRNISGLPEEVVRDVEKLCSAEDQLLMANINPTEDELAAHLGWTRQRINLIQTCSLPPIPFSRIECQIDGKRQPFVEGIPSGTISPSRVTELITLGNLFDQALDTLPPEQALTIQLRQGLSAADPRTWTLEEIGQLFDVSREAIRQWETAGLLALRRSRKKPVKQLRWYLRGK